jgi:hypothetical protein
MAARRRERLFEAWADRALWSGGASCESEEAYRLYLAFVRAHGEPRGACTLLSSAGAARSLRSRGLR